MHIWQHYQMHVLTAALHVDSDSSVICWFCLQCPWQILTAYSDAGIDSSARCRFWQQRKMQMNRWTRIFRWKFRWLDKDAVVAKLILIKFNHNKKKLTLNKIVIDNLRLVKGSSYCIGFILSFWSIRTQWTPAPANYEYLYYSG